MMSDITADRLTSVPDAGRRTTDGNAAGEPFRFTGRTGEYFGIFIVNVFLTVVTLGIYSAWAKVRTRRYFYGHTEIAGHTLDYLAKPITILIGRAIVFAAVIVYTLVAEVAGPLSLVLLLGLIAVTPVLINRGLRFNARMTVYRNVRLNWHGTPWRTFKAFILWPLVAPLTLGLMAPYASRATGRYAANMHSYGTAPFSAEPALGRYHRALGLAALIIVPSVVVGALIAAPPIANAVATLQSTPYLTPEQQAQLLAGPIGIAIVFGALGIALGFVTYALLARNTLLSALQLDGKHRFRSEVSVGAMVWITVTNAVVVALTLGLMIPWARIRMWRYQASRLAVIPEVSVDAIVDDAKPDGNAAAAEYLDYDGFEIV